MVFHLQENCGAWRGAARCRQQPEVPGSLRGEGEILKFITYYQFTTLVFLYLYQLWIYKNQNLKRMKKTEYNLKYIQL